MIDGAPKEPSDNQPRRVFPPRLALASRWLVRLIFIFVVIILLGKKEDTLSSSASGSVAKLGPHEEVKLPPFSSVSASEFPQKIRLYIGAERSAEYEIFTVNFK